MELKSFYDSVVEGDFLSDFKPLIDSGRYIIHPETGKIHNAEEYRGSVALSPDKDWIFPLNPTSDYHCDWYHDIAKLFHFVPEFCLDCWKVVVRPRSIEELFKLLVVQEQMAKEDPECYCKCGVERRPYVFGNYGGYFYTRSMEQGLDRMDQVRERVDKIISPDVPIILKRYCTEFELDFGPSASYESPENFERLTALMKEHCAMVPFTGVQPDICKRKIMREWIKFAWDRGDRYVFGLTAGKPIVRDVCTYHRTYPVSEETS